MEPKTRIYFSTQIENLSFILDKGKLIFFSIEDKNPPINQIESLISESSNRLLKIILSQLKNYFISAIPFQSIPLAPHGTLFQQSVWNELMKIPVGETRTYGEIAKKINSSARAVGNACRNNPIQLIIPCHRVISAKGIGGYAGKTDGRNLDLKRWLLKHEGVEL